MWKWRDGGVREQQLCPEREQRGGETRGVADITGGRGLTAGEEAVLGEHGDGVDEQDRDWAGSAQGAQRATGQVRVRTVEEAAQAEEQHGGGVGAVQQRAVVPSGRNTRTRVGSTSGTAAVASARAGGGGAGATRAAAQVWCVGGCWTCERGSTDCRRGSQAVASVLLHAAASAQGLGRLTRARPVFAAGPWPDAAQILASGPLIFASSAPPLHPQGRAGSLRLRQRAAR